MLVKVDSGGLVTAMLADGTTLRLRGAIGRSGLTANKREGDGATPLGVLPLRRVLYRADRIPPPSCTVPRSPLTPTDGWCDDPNDPAYNCPITLPSSAHHETLWRSDALYDLIGVLGWNDTPAIPGRGSAIFLHVAQANLAPTDGCIALPYPDLDRLLRAGLDRLVVVAN